MLILNTNYWSTISTADDHDQALMQLCLCKQSKFLKPPYHKNAQRYDYAVNIQINFMLSLSNWPQWVKKFTKLPFPQNKYIHKTNNLFAILGLTRPIFFLQTKNLCHSRFLPYKLFATGHMTTQSNSIMASLLYIISPFCKMQ